MNKLVIITCLIAAASALSCLPCTPEVEANCPKPKCPKYRQVVGGICGCCKVCEVGVGQLCTESQPCRRGLTCYKVDGDQFLPFFFKGICIRSRTAKQLPEKPTFCAKVQTPLPVAGAGKPIKLA